MFEMARIPLFPEVLLEIYKCIGPAEPVKNWGNAFRSAVELSRSGQIKKSIDLLDHIFSELGLDEDEVSDAFGNIVDDSLDFHKPLELQTWTHKASMQQVVWHLLCYTYAPMLGRRVANWQIDEVEFSGMPTDKLWYLPQVDSKKMELSMPVEHVLDWWLVLIGGIEQVRKSIPENSDNADTPDSIVRNINNWRDGSIPHIETIEKYFNDDIDFKYKNTLDISLNESEGATAKDFKVAKEYLQSRNIDEKQLAIQIPLSVQQVNRVLRSKVDSDFGLTYDQISFTILVTQRYSAPKNSDVRKRLRVARAMQAGYKKLQQYLTPEVDWRNIDPKENKILQAVNLYISALALTTDSHNYAVRATAGLPYTNSKQEKKLNLESLYFEKHVPKEAQLECFASIMPSVNRNVVEIVAGRLSAKFALLDITSSLKDLYLFYDSEWVRALKAVHQQEAIVEHEYYELLNELLLGNYSESLTRVKNINILARAMEYHELSDRQYNALLTRAKVVTSDNTNEIPIIRAQLRRALSFPNQGEWGSDIQSHVASLLVNFRKHPDFSDFEAYYLHYKARHLIARNEFDRAHDVLKKALEASLKSNHGRLTGEIALNYFACFLAKNKFIPNNHEKYYRYVMEYPVGPFPSNDIDEVAEKVKEYFWRDLYRPYDERKRFPPSVIE